MRLSLVLFGLVVLNVQKICSEQQLQPYILNPFPFDLLRNGDQLDWPQWAVLQGLPDHLRPGAPTSDVLQDNQVLGMEDRVPDSPRTLSSKSSAMSMDNKKQRSNIVRNLGLCHFKICPVGKRLSDYEDEMRMHN